MHKLNTPTIQRAAIAHQQGFTLIEIIVALTIGVLMTTAGYQALRSAVASIEQMNHTIEQLNDVDRVFQLLSSDFTHAVNRPWVDVYAQRQPAFEALFGDRLGQSDAAITGVDNYIIRLIRGGWANPLERRRSHLQLVGYRITQGDNDTASKVLWRDYWAVIDSADAPAVKRRRLLGGIEELRLRFLPAGVDNLSDNAWVTGWPPRGRSSSPLPLAVEIVLTLEEMGEVTRLFTVAETP